MGVSLTQGLEGPELAELLGSYRRHLSLHARRSPRTVEAYLDVVTRYSAHCEGRFEVGSVRDFVREASRKLAASSQAQWSSALKNFLKWASAEGHLSAALEREVQRPKTPKRLVGAVDAEDLPLLLKVIEKRPPHEQLLFELLYGSGLRLSEAFALRRADFSRDAGSALILGKGRKERRVPLTQRGQALLLSLPESSPWPGHPSVRTLRRWVEHWGMAAALDERTGRLHPHKLRHSIASHLLQRGAKLPEIQRLLGHSKLSTTERYTHLDIEDLVRIYDRSFPK